MTPRASMFTDRPQPSELIAAIRAARTRDELRGYRTTERVLEGDLVAEHADTRLLTDDDIGDLIARGHEHAVVRNPGWTDAQVTVIVEYCFDRMSNSLTESSAREAVRALDAVRGGLGEKSVAAVMPMFKRDGSWRRLQALAACSHTQLPFKFWDSLGSTMGWNSGYRLLVSHPSVTDEIMLRLLREGPSRGELGERIIEGHRHLLRDPEWRAAFAVSNSWPVLLSLVQTAESGPELEPLLPHLLSRPAESFLEVLSKPRVVRLLRKNPRLWAPLLTSAHSEVREWAIITSSLPVKRRSRQVRAKSAPSTRRPSR